MADTVKVQWQAYLGAGQLLLSDMGRVLAAVVEDIVGPPRRVLRHHVARRPTRPRYGDGAPDGPAPNGRDHFAVALAKHGLGRRDVAPNINLFKSVRVEPDGSLQVRRRVRGPARPSSCGSSCACIVTIVNVPHPLDDRPEYTVTPLAGGGLAGRARRAPTTRPAPPRRRPNGPT